MDFKIYVVLIILVGFVLALLILFQLGVFNSLFPKALPHDIPGWIDFAQGLVGGGSSFANSFSGTSYILGIIIVVMAVIILVKIVQEARSNEGGERE